MLRERYDWKKMRDMEIYPQHWKEVEEEWGYVEGGFEEATRFVRETAERGMALLVYIN